MSDATGLGKLVPGFDFLQSLVKNAGAALPGIGQWVAPTLDPAELDKRIGELRTVQYWLEQNARMLAATIQALEVQRMTLSTLKSMNVQMADLGESLKIKPFEVPAAAASSAAAAPPAPSDTSPVAARTKKPTVPTPGQAIDPMQWWGALTTQFAELATNAMKDTAADAAKSIAGGMVKQSMEAATETMKQAAGAPGSAAAEAARIFGGKPAASSAPTKKAAKRRRPGSAAA
jgi:hypothetical protein